MARRLWHLIRHGLGRFRWPLAGLVAFLVVLACVLVIPTMARAVGTWRPSRHAPSRREGEGYQRRPYHPAARRRRGSDPAWRLLHLPAATDKP
jgi:hypothetical protein